MDRLSLVRRTPLRTLAILAIALALTTAPRGAQAQAEGLPQNAVSANPFGLLIEWFNAEYERVVSPTATAGFGGSFFSDEGDDYLNMDVFFRLYPQGAPMDGWAFGGKLGLTNVEGGTYAGFGFDVNRSWLLGVQNNFYVGIGFGLKRLVGVGDDPDFEMQFIPTIRIVNVGYAF
jgi:hypothetical protein